MSGPANLGVTQAMGVAETVGEVRVCEKPFGRALVEAARKQGAIVGLTADLGKYTDMDVFAHEFQTRFFQVGMAEQNLVGIAAGLSRCGFIPFATTYCVFASRRAYEQVAIDVALGRANVKIIAGLPGLTTGYGATHQGIDDLALFRTMPNMVVIDPCDATDIQQAVHAIAEYPGPVYMRILRANVPVVLDPATYKFRIGSIYKLQSGSDICLISTGLMTQRSLAIARQLEDEDGVHASVVHVPTLKPLDVEGIANVVRSASLVVTLENHSVSNGLGTAITEAMFEADIRVSLHKIGIPDRFIECGATEYLNDKYGLSTSKLLSTCRELLSRL